MANNRGYLWPNVTQDRLSVGRLEDLITAQLRRVDILLTRAFHDATEQVKLKDGVISSLALIVVNPGISQNEISRQIGMDKSAVVAVVDTLEALGWAVRIKSREDRRRHALQATPEGMTHLDNLIDAVEKLESDMLAMVSADDLDTLRSILDRIYLSCTRGEEAAAQ